jgi:hypothetical protein
MTIPRRALLGSLLVVLATFVAGSASAVTVNFNGTSGGVQSYFGTNVTYTEQGVSIFVPIDSYLFFDSPTFGYGAPSPDGTDHAQIDGGPIVISAYAPFLLVGFQVGTRIAAYQSTEDSIVLTGYQVGASRPLSFMQTIDAGTFWTDVVLPANWSNLTHVEFLGSSRSFGAMFLDNIQISAVPEPGSHNLLWAGLVLLAARRRMLRHACPGPTRRHEHLELAGPAR